MPIPSRAATRCLVSLIIVAVVTTLCVRFVDIPVALLVKEFLSIYRPWGHVASTMPDLLLELVIVATIGAFCLRFIRIRKGKDDRFNRFLLLLSCDAPASYLAKTILKPLFGRLNNRLWLDYPDLYGFYWFDLRRGFDGFPSGHMLVLVALLALLVRFYPKTLLPAVLLAMATAIALMITGYHFVSDIIAGVYVGILLEAMIHAILCRRNSYFGAFGFFPESR